MKKNLTLNFFFFIITADRSQPSIYLHTLFTFSWLFFSVAGWYCLEVGTERRSKLSNSQQAADAEKIVQLAIFWLISDAIITFLVSLFVSELLLARTFLAIKSKYPERTFAVGYGCVDGNRFVLLGGGRENVFDEEKKRKKLRVKQTSKFLSCGQMW